MSKICLIAGSSSDLPRMAGGLELLDELEVGYDLKILSAHRTPAELADYIREAEEKGAGIFIGIAGKAAHLPGVIASHTNRPVLGVPILSSTLAGMDSLFSMVQMPSGIPVGVMGINNLKNAVIFALQVLALGEPALEAKLALLKEEKREKIRQENEAIAREGWQSLLKEE
ncbi:MAG: 5-(carboxyamino)imidazole ribonucleotide mutase [Halanaerobium sp.]|nr:5-(carboxyamino)imidazole ribonucleotide mutase [Halanaerobium sp.]